MTETRKQMKAIGDDIFANYGYDDFVRATKKTINFIPADIQYLYCRFHYIYTLTDLSVLGMFEDEQLLLAELIDIHNVIKCFFAQIAQSEIVEK